MTIFFEKIKRTFIICRQKAVITLKTIFLEKIKKTVITLQALRFKQNFLSQS